MRLQKKYLALVLVLANALFALQAREISMLTVEWAPHYGSELPEKGLTTALVKAAFKAGGHDAEVDFVPWARALREVEEGSADLVMGAYFNEERDKIFRYSKEIYSLDVGMIARPDLGVSRYNSLRELRPYKIGVSRGFTNSEEFDSASYLDKQVATYPNLNIRKLFRGRIDIAVMNFDLFRYEAKKEGFCTSDVEFMEPPLKKQGLYVMASRNIEDSEGIIEDFNRGLDSIRESGEFLRIVSRFRK